MDHMDNSRNHLVNVIETGTSYTINDGDANKDVTVTSGDIKLFVDNLPGYPFYDDNDGHMIVGHRVQIRTANANYNTAHKAITDLTYEIIGYVEAAARTLTPKLLTKSPPWVDITYDVDSYTVDGEATRHIGNIDFICKLIVFKDATG